MLKIFSSLALLPVTIVFFACTLSHSLSAAEPAVGPNPTLLQESFQLMQVESDRQLADALTDRKDWTSLDVAVVNLQLRRKSLVRQQKWTPQDERSYIALMLYICGRLTSVQVDRNRTSQMVSKYAADALQKSDNLSAAEEAGFVLMTFQSFRYEFSRSQAGQYNEEEWTKYKAQQTQRWLHAAAKLNAAIDKNFDVKNPDNWPSLSVPVPKGSGVGFVSGISPEAIVDPALREKYKAAIKKNAEKSRRLQDQIRLKNLHQLFFPNLINVLIMAYSAPPRDAYVDQVKQYIKDVNLANQIIENVKARMDKANNGGEEVGSGHWAVE
jgi:hypothetical protein